jgi:hypothetical protein
MFATLTLLLATLTRLTVPIVGARQGEVRHVRLAVIGDFGANNNNEAQVAAMVRKWDAEQRLDAVLTVGDNNYNDGLQSTVEGNVGKYYSFFMHPYKSYRNPPLYQGAPDKMNRFFPATGNHDWGDGLENYLDYYAGIRSEGGTPQHYYARSFGPVDVFFLDSTFRDMQQQTQWLMTSLSESSALWKVIICHHPPYTSGQHGNTAKMQLPYFEWGAHLVLSGHDHNYERIFKQAGNCPTFPYIVDGAGGARIRSIRRQEQGSQLRYSSKHGALLIRATPAQLQTQFISVDHAIQDTMTLTKDPSSACGYSVTTAFGAVPPAQPRKPVYPSWPRKFMQPSWPQGPQGPSWPSWPRWPSTAQEAVSPPTRY